MIMGLSNRPARNEITETVFTVSDDTESTFTFRQVLETLNTLTAENQELVFAMELQTDGEFLIVTVTGAVIAVTEFMLEWQAVEPVIAN